MSDEANALERLRAWRTRAEQRWEITHDWAGYSLDLDERDRDGCIWRSVSVAGDGGGIETEKNIVLGTIDKPATISAMVDVALKRWEERYGKDGGA